MNETEKIDVTKKKCQRIIQALVESGIELGLPNTPIARFEFSCCVILHSCMVIALSKDDALIEKIIAYISENGDMIPSSPAYTFEEFKKILEYRKHFYCSHLIHGMSQILAELIELATKYGHFVHISKDNRLNIPEERFSYKKAYQVLQVFEPLYSIMEELSDGIYSLADPEGAAWRKKTMEEIKKHADEYQSDAFITIGQPRRRILTKEEERCAIVAKKITASISASNYLRQDALSTKETERKTREPQQKQETKDILFHTPKQLSPSSPQELSAKKQASIWSDVAILTVIGCLVASAIGIVLLNSSLVKRADKTDVNITREIAEHNFNKRRKESISNRDLQQKNRHALTSNNKSTNTHVSSPQTNTKEAVQSLFWSAIIASNETAVANAIASGADVNAWKIEGIKKLSALQYAVATFDYEMTECLINHGADVRVENTDFPNLWSILVRKDLTKEAEKIIILLVDKGLDPNELATTEINDQLKTLLKMQANEEFSKFKPNDLYTLADINEGAQEHLSRYENLKSIQTPIIKHCATCGCKSAISHLLANGAKADVDIPGSLIGGSALAMAAKKGYTDIMNMLISHNARINETEPMNKANPLHFAVSQGQYAAAELLLVHGADVNQMWADGTALHTAAMRGNIPLLKLLIRYGATINQKAPNGGYLPLRMALTGQHYDAARFLIENGSNLSEPDDDTSFTDGMAIVILAEEVAPAWKNLLTNEQWEQAKQELQTWVEKQKKMIFSAITRNDALRVDK